MRLLVGDTKLITHTRHIKVRDPGDALSRSHP